MVNKKRERETVTALPWGLRECPNCRVWFRPKRADQRFCEVSCRVAFHVKQR